jgi:hypothetical protein
MGAHIINGDAVLERHVAMRSLIVDIVIMKQRILSMSIPNRDMMSLAIKSKGSSVHFVTLSKMFSKCVSTVGSAWGSTFARLASFLTMISQNSNTTVMDVVYVELGAAIISSTALNVAVAIRLC